MPTYNFLYTPILVSLYLLLSLIATYHILIIRWHRHKLLSFNFGFLCLCVLFCAVRSLFWFFETDNVELYLILYWFPINIQFGMFYLVTLYIMRLVQRSEQMWDGRYKSMVFWASVGVNAMFFVATIGWLVACVQIHDDKDPAYAGKTVDTCNDIHGYFAAVCFLSLGLSLLYYGVKLHIIASKEDSAAKEATTQSTAMPDAAAVAEAKKAVMNGGRQVPQVNWGPNESRFRTEAICFLLLTIFVSRAIFDLLQSKIFDGNNIPVEDNKAMGKDIENPVVFWTYVLFEIFPTALMLFFFGAAVSAAGSALQARFYRTLTESFQGAGGYHIEPGPDDDDEIIETDTASALWPVPKEVADVLFAQHVDPAQSVRPKGLLEDDSRYDSPVEYGYGFSSPLLSNNHQTTAVSRGFAAAMGQDCFQHYSNLTTQQDSPPNSGNGIAHK